MLLSQLQGVRGFTAQCIDQEMDAERPRLILSWPTLGTLSVLTER